MKSNHDNQNQITPFAVTNYRDIRKVFGIKQKNRRGHMYILGKTGTGKSTLLANMIKSDMDQGNGLGLIDPSGDLAEDILDLVPEERIRDVIYFNPADTKYPLGFNPLEGAEPDRRHLVASGLISVFKKIWPEFWGPRLEHILRNAIMALSETPGSTMLDIPQMLTDKNFRQKVVERLQNLQVKNFWETEFERYSSWLKTEASSPILNKVGQYLSAPMLRNILGQSKSAFDLRKIMDEKKILIVNLSKGKIGEDNCSLLGAMLIARLQLAALSRDDLARDKRVSFYLYVDEVQSFATDSFTDILSEVRKYGLGLIMAHQYLDQLEESIRKAVFGNVGTLITFRLGQEDALEFAKEFYPVFERADLINLANYHIYLKLMIDGVTSKAFSATTLPTPTKKNSPREEVIRESRKRYAKRRKQVEEQILSRQNDLRQTKGQKNGVHNQRLF